MKFSWSKLAVLAVAGTLGGALWSGAAQAEPVKIGFNVPLTGFAAADGKSALTGAQLAVEQANAEGGIDGKMIELVVYDDQASPKESVPIATKLATQDKVNIAISGSYSGATRAGAKLAGDILGKKRAVLITLKNDFGKSLAAGFKEAAGKFGVTIVAEYEYSIKDRQFGPIVSKVKADNPDVIYASGYFFTAGPLVSQLRAAGIEVPIIGQEGYDSQKFIEIAGAAAEGTIITTSLDRDSDQAETKAFIAAFEKKAGYKVDMVAASGHTAVMVAVAAMRLAGTTDRKAIRDAIAGLTLRASTGEISFNKLGEVRKDVQVQVVRDGNWRRHSVIDDAELLAPPTE